MNNSNHFWKSQFFKQTLIHDEFCLICKKVCKDESTQIDLWKNHLISENHLESLYNQQFQNQNLSEENKNLSQFVDSIKLFDYSQAKKLFEQQKSELKNYFELNILSLSKINRKEGFTQTLNQMNENSKVFIAQCRKLIQILILKSKERHAQLLHLLFELELDINDVPYLNFQLILEGKFKLIYEKYKLNQINQMNYELILGEFFQVNNPPVFPIKYNHNIIQSKRISYSFLPILKLNYGHRIRSINPKSICQLSNQLNNFNIQRKTIFNLVRNQRENHLESSLIDNI